MDYEIFTIEETDLDWLTVAENLLNRDIKLGNKKDYTKSEYLMTATLLGLKWRPDFKELSETKEFIKFNNLLLKQIKLGLSQVNKQNIEHVNKLLPEVVELTKDLAYECQKANMVNSLDHGLKVYVHILGTNKKVALDDYVKNIYKNASRVFNSRKCSFSNDKAEKLVP